MRNLADERVVVGHLHPGSISTNFQESLDQLYLADPSVVMPPLRQRALYLAVGRNELATREEFIKLVTASHPTLI